MSPRELTGDVEELKRAQILRLAADRQSSMSERLARVHRLCKQMSALKGAASGR
ncbi:MAG TPA: hypothetical protein VIV13_06730 [Solirubrobacterales bacterium]